MYQHRFVKMGNSKDDTRSARPRSFIKRSHSVAGTIRRCRRETSEGHQNKTPYSLSGSRERTRTWSHYSKDDLNTRYLGEHFSDYNCAECISPLKKKMSRGDESYTGRQNRLNEKKRCMNSSEEILLLSADGSGNTAINNFQQTSFGNTSLSGLQKAVFGYTSFDRNQNADNDDSASVLLGQRTSSEKEKTSEEPLICIPSFEDLLFNCRSENLQQNLVGAIIITGHPLSTRDATRACIEGNTTTVLSDENNDDYFPSLRRLDTLILGIDDDSEDDDKENVDTNNDCSESTRNALDEMDELSMSSVLSQEVVDDQQTDIHLLPNKSDSFKNLVRQAQHFRCLVCDSCLEILPLDRPTLAEEEEEDEAWFSYFNFRGSYNTDLYCPQCDCGRQVYCPR